MASRDSCAELFSVCCRRRDGNRSVLRARHQVRPTEQLQVRILFRFDNFTRWWRFACTAGDRRCRFLTTQCREGEIIILGRILGAMITLYLFQILVKFWICWCNWRCWNCNVGRSANYHVLFATALDFSQLQMKLINQTDNIWFLLRNREKTFVSADFVTVFEKHYVTPLSERWFLFRYFLCFRNEIYLQTRNARRAIHKGESIDTSRSLNLRFLLTKPPTSFQQPQDASIPHCSCSANDKAASNPNGRKGKGRKYVVVSSQS